MSKYVKDMISSELQSRYSGLDSALWVELVGADGITTNLFRRELRGKKMRIEMVKNSLFRRAVDAKPLERLGKSIEGPAALVTGGDSLVEVAKVIEQWLPRMKGMKLRGALIEGEYLDERAVQGLAKMPTKRDMQGRVASAILSPGAKIAGAVRAPGANIAGCLKALMAKLEMGEAVAAPGESAPAPAAAPPAES